MDIYTEEQVRDMLRAKIRYGYGQNDLARDAGVSNVVVSGVLSGKKGLGFALPRVVGMFRLSSNKKSPDDVVYYARLGD